MREDVTLTEEYCQRCPEGQQNFLYAVRYRWAKGDRIEMEDARICLLGPLLEPRNVPAVSRTTGTVNLCAYCDGPATRFAVSRRT